MEVKPTRAEAPACTVKRFGTQAWFSAWEGKGRRHSRSFFMASQHSPSTAPPRSMLSVEHPVSDKLSKLFVRDTEDLSTNVLRMLP